MSALRPLRVAMVLYGDITFDSRVQREANSLAEAGHSVTIFCLAGSQATSSLLDARVKVQVVMVGDRPGLPHTPSPYLSRAAGLGRIVTRLTWLAAYVRNLRRWGHRLGRASDDFDVWHAHDLTGLVGATIARPASAALVYDMHDLIVETDTGARLPGPLRTVLRWYERRLARAAALLVTINNGLADYQRRHFGPRPIAVVHNCVPAWSPPQPPPSFLRDAAGLTSADPIVLYHGLLDADRGIETLVAAMLEPGLERAHLLLLGFGQHRQRFVAIAAEHRFAGRIHILDPVPPAELMPWVASADVGVMPNQPRTLNDRLSTPNKLFESIGAGLPVVSSDFPERRRIILDDPLGPLGTVCDPTDPRDLARAIQSILDLDEASRMELRQRCTAAAHQRWNWESEARALLDGYRMIADSGMADSPVADGR